MRYYLIERQSGGCDYTIGCGIRVTELIATDLEDAKKKAAKNIGSKWRGGDERSIDNAELLEVSESFDLAAFLNQRASDRAKAKKSKEETNKLERDRAELKRLQRKLGIS
jgi:hypothetical protein